MLDAPNALIVEGMVTTDGRLVLLGATTWERPPLPVIHNGEQWGTIIEIARLGDVIAVRTDVLVPMGWCLTADTGDVEVEYEPAPSSWWKQLVALLLHRHVSPDGGMIVFRRLKVLGAHLSEESAWPWPSAP